MNTHLLQFRLKTFNLFTALSKTVQEYLLNNAQRLSVKEGIYLFRQGNSSSDGMYIILDGQLQLIYMLENGTEIILDHADRGAIVGEMGLLVGVPRILTVKAAVNSELAHITKSNFDKLAGEHPQVIEELGNLIHERLRYSRLIQVLPDLFSNFNHAVNDLISEFSWVHLRRGEILVNQGETGNAMYVLVSGRLQVIMADAQKHEQPVTEIRPGNTVGEMSLFTNEPRIASVYASRDSELVKLTKTAFDQLTQKHPEILGELPDV